MLKKSIDGNDTIFQFKIDSISLEKQIETPFQNKENRSISCFEDLKEHSLEFKVLLSKTFILIIGCTHYR